jgi:O-antigen/teichoic acid export membrane protein
MEGMRSALAASIAARAMAAALGLLALPVYLRQLGVEAYGVVGLFASLQAVLAFMDFGLPTTLTRQLAGLAQDRESRAEGRDTTRTFELAYFALAAGIGLALAAAAPFVAAHWVQLESLAAAQVAGPLQLAALSLAAGWPANLYAAGLAGLHRQVPLAFSSSLFGVLRVALAVLFLWREPTLQSFFAAQVAASLAQSIGMRQQLWRALRLSGHRPSFRGELLRRSRRFAAGMTAITITSILLSQGDKLILSHLLPLAEFGVYSVAVGLATGLYVLISPVFSVIYPRIAAQWQERNQKRAADLFHDGAQAMALLVMPLAAMLACFPQASLFVLTADRAIAAQAAPVLVLLVLGAACNGLMNIPYALQLAAGWTRLSVAINAAALVCMAPATWWAASRFGGVGGAAAWAALNIAYVVLTPQWLHRRLLPAHKWRWYLQDVCAPAAASLGAALLLVALWPVGDASRLVALAHLAAGWAIVATVTLLSLKGLRARAGLILRS